MKHLFEKIVARLGSMADRDLIGEGLTEADINTLAVAAAVIKRYGEHLTRLKAAIGPELVYAATIEAEKDIGKGD